MRYSALCTPNPKSCRPLFQFLSLHRRQSTMGFACRTGHARKRIPTVYGFYQCIAAPKEAAWCIANNDNQKLENTVYTSCGATGLKRIIDAIVDHAHMVPCLASFAKNNRPSSLTRCPNQNRNHGLKLEIPSSTDLEFAVYIVLRADKLPVRFYLIKRQVGQ